MSWSICEHRLTTSPHRFPGSHPLFVASDGGSPGLRPVGFVDKLSGLSSVRFRTPIKHLCFWCVVANAQRVGLRLDAEVKEMSHAICEVPPIRIGPSIWGKKSLTFWCLNGVACPIERSEGMSRHILWPDPVPAIGGFDRWGKVMFSVTHKRSSNVAADSKIWLRLAPGDMVRASESRGFGLGKKAGQPLLIRWSQVRILYVLPGFCESSTCGETLQVLFYCP